MQVTKVLSRQAKKTRTILFGSKRRLVAVMAIFMAAVGAGAVSVYATVSHDNSISQGKVSNLSTVGNTGLNDKISSNNLNVDLKSASKTSSNTSENSSTTTLIVNGQSVPVDQTGSVHKNFSSSDGTSSINVSIDNQSSSSTGHGGDSE